jgi:excisionase family DNA binding protein
MEGQFGTTEQSLLRVQDVAKILNLGCSKVWQLIYYEGLPVVRFGRAVRVSPSSLQEWLDQREKQSESA